MGAESTGNLSGRARFDFFRPAPPAGYVHGLPAARRTDKGSGDIPPEKAGVDYFPYAYRGASPTENMYDPPRAMLAEITNRVQNLVSTGTHRGALWLEGSSRIEDTIYWFNLVIETDALLVGVIANRPNRMLSSDAPLTIVDAVNLVLSDVWRDVQGHNRIGSVIVQDQRITAAREAIKEYAGPGGFGTLGGHGGVIGTATNPKLTFLPTTRYGRTSEVRYSLIPTVVPGIRRAPGGAIRRVEVTVKDAAGQLCGNAIPAVELTDFNAWMTANPPGTRDPVVARIDSAIDRCLGESSLCGLIAVAPTGSHFDHLDEIMINRAAMSGFVVVKVYRGTPRMFVGGNAGSLYLAGSNLNANKARVLLMACLLRFGCPPPAADATRPTPAEIDAVKAHLVQMQEVFDTH